MTGKTKTKDMRAIVADQRAVRQYVAQLIKKMDSGGRRTRRQEPSGVDY